MIVNDELEKIWKKAINIYFKCVLLLVMLNVQLTRLHQ
jgi:hypothetical protein